MAKKNAAVMGAALVLTGTAIAAQRQEQLTKARAVYLTANLSAKAKGGSSFVGKVAKDLAGTGKIYGTIDELGKALRTIDPVKALAKADELIVKMKSTIEPDAKTNKAANVPTKQTIEARAAYASFLGIDADGKPTGVNGYEEVANSLDTFHKYSALTYCETFTDKSGVERTRPVDVRDDANALFGFKVTAKVRLAGRAAF